MSNANHVTIRGNIVRNTPGGGIAAIETDHVTIEKNTVSGTSHWSVYGTSGISVFHSRDVDGNTTDGDGWDVRLSHLVPTGNYGYPRLFKNFPDEIVKPMLELGGGSFVADRVHVRDVLGNGREGGGVGGQAGHAGQ